MVHIALMVRLNAAPQCKVTWKQVISLYDELFKAQSETY